MHSSLVRLQNVFGFFTTMAFTVAGLIAASVLFFPQLPSASIDVRNVQVYAHNLLRTRFSRLILVAEQCQGPSSLLLLKARGICTY